MSKSKKIIICMQILYLIFLCHSYLNEYIGDYEINEENICILLLPIFIYWFGIWIYGWGWCISLIKKCYELLSKPFKLINNKFCSGRIGRLKYVKVMFLISIITTLAIACFMGYNLPQISNENKICLSNPNIINSESAQSSIRWYLHFRVSKNDILDNKPENLHHFYCEQKLKDNIDYYNWKYAWMMFFVTLFFVISITPSTIKRCHDINMTGKYVVILYVISNILSLIGIEIPYDNFYFSILNTLLLIANFCLSLLLIFKKGDIKENKYGEPNI